MFVTSRKNLCINIFLKLDNIPVCKLFEELHVKDGLPLHWDICEQIYIIIQERLQKDYKAFLSILRKILFDKKCSGERNHKIFCRHVAIRSCSQ